MYEWFGRFWPGMTVEMDPLLILSIILLAGLLGGWLARRLHLPVMNGNMLAGILLGPACLNLFRDANVAEALQPLSTFAMGLIAVVMGSHLSYRRIHNALRRIIGITLGEVLGAVVLVTLAARLVGAEWPVAFVLGTIAAATSPGTTLHLVREMRAKGTFVKTLLSVVALDNILCIMLFAFSSTLLGDYYANEGGAFGWALALIHTLWQFSGSLFLALVLGKTTERFVHSKHAHDFSVVFVMILLSAGLSRSIGLSPLLTGLFFGVYLGNASEETRRQTEALEPIELLLFSCFFTLAGVSLHLDSLAETGLLCGAYVLARAIGKSLGACAGGLIARAKPRIWSNAALGMVPEAAIAIGLVLLLSDDPDIPQGTWHLIEAIVLGAVAINEMSGPFFTRLALNRAKEAHKDRRRLIEFLQEEFILTDIEAADKWEALHKLTEFYGRTHGVPAHLREPLYQSVVEREREVTTAVGHGAAIPHGRLSEGAGVRGVLGICREGIDFEALDGEAVRLIMLVVTPIGYEKEHLEVMASLAQMISHEEIRTRLIAAMDANDAWEVIESEEGRGFNDFLDDPDPA